MDDLEEPDNVEQHASLLTLARQLSATASTFEAQLAVRRTLRRVRHAAKVGHQADRDALALVLLKRALVLRELRSAVALSRVWPDGESPARRKFMGHMQAVVCILSRAGFSDREIASYMGSTVGAVKRLRERSLKQLHRLAAT